MCMTISFYSAINKNKTIATNAAIVMNNFNLCAYFCVYVNIFYLYY